MNKIINTSQGTEDSQYAASRLGTESVGKLLFKFSLPAITGMLANALYNIVDRIFVGQEVNPDALAGLTLIMPLMTFSLAFAMLFGIGTANLISMRMGEGRKQDAENALNHCFFLLLGVGLIIMSIGLWQRDAIISLLGAQENSNVLGYAQNYFQIILYGTVFSLLGFGFSHCTRAQGFPAMTMITMLIGAGLNVILDYLFIRVFKWEVEGAAYATIISQAVAALWILRFSMGKKAIIKLRFRSFKLSFSAVRYIMAFGSAQFLLQMMMSCVQLFYNYSIGIYGPEALQIENGGDIALGGISISSSISMLIFMTVFGINQGAQPILGYNYGARLYNRVLKTYLRAVAAGTVICVLGFIVVQLFPGSLVRIFANESNLDVSGESFNKLMEFSTYALRIMMLMLPTAAFQIVSTNFFVVTGRPKISIFLSSLRQCLILIPCIFIFGRIWGLWGVVAAAPVADALALLITGTMIFFELRKLKKA